MKVRCSRINPEQVRLLLFKECDWRGRKLLFDSSTIEKVPTNRNDQPAAKTSTEVPYIVEVLEGFKYVYKGPAADANTLGDMIFGAVAMNHKEVSLKIHIMDEPRRLMCTKVFFVPAPRRIGRVDRKASAEQPDHMGSSTSKPLIVPSKDEVALSFSFDRGDSGFYGEHSIHSSVSSNSEFFSMCDAWDGGMSQDDLYTFHSPVGRKLSASSAGSWQRRASRSVATKFDFGSQGSRLLSVANANSSDSQMNSNSSTSSTTDSLSSGAPAPSPQRRSKLGLALLITVADAAEMDLVRRCVEHCGQLQALVLRMRAAALAAGGSGGGSGGGGGFVATLHRAAADAARLLTDLMYGPRVQSMWLSVVASGAGSSKLAESLMTDICSVLTASDTKHTNFFFSTLLTQVLTHHLGWVATVSPYDVLDPQKALPEESCKRPYNALWAQLNDLCGSIGVPPRAARTIISCSANNQLANRLLLVLTYFLRCGEVNRTYYKFQTCDARETNVVQVPVKRTECSGLRRTVTKHVLSDNLQLPTIRDQCDSSETLVPSDALKNKSVSDLVLKDVESDSLEQPMTSQLKRNPTIAISLHSTSNSSVNSSTSEEVEQERKVVFVLGDDEKLVGLKNKSIGGKCVKKSKQEDRLKHECVGESTKESADGAEGCAEKSARADSPSKCCGQTQHSKPIKHSGFKFEFDKYPQIVTNYMKSKNLEILDRHFIGKPGNLKLENYHFDPTIVPPIQEERCEACVKCQLMESMLQTPTNASELEFMNDMPRLAEPQWATEAVEPPAPSPAPKTFVHRRSANAILVNVTKPEEDKVPDRKPIEVEKKEFVKEKRFFSMLNTNLFCETEKSGFDVSLLGGITDHYVPELVLQGTVAKPAVWESELKRDLDLSSYLNKSLDAPIQALAIIGDTNAWEVRVLSRGAALGAGGVSALVAAMLDALPHMWRARVPAHQCLLYLEGKLREFCVLSKTLADMLMTTDFCDIDMLTKSLNIDINDVPLLMAVATTHSPQVARRYGISYR